MTMNNESTPIIEVDSSYFDVILGPTQAGRPIPTQMGIVTEMDRATHLVTTIFVNASADVRLRDLVATLPPLTAPNK
jgi:hypothetical protein